MKMSTTVATLLFLFIGTTLAKPTETGECPYVMVEGGISAAFAPFVAHSIHSLTVEDIRYFFKEDVTEDNYIPTVNMNLTSEQRVLPNAPLAGYSDDFSTMSMKAFDRVMRNMDRSWWGLTNYGMLEKLVHAYHMAEIWDQTSRQYEMVSRLLDPQSQLCSCVRDVKNNDVWNYLNLLAFKIRYPGISSGNNTFTEQYLSKKTKRSAGYDLGVGYSFGYSLGWFRSAQIDFYDVDFDLSDVELLKDVAEKLVDGDGVMKSDIDSEENWEEWRQVLLQGMDDASYYDLAVFMFCSLN